MNESQSADAADTRAVEAGFIDRRARIEFAAMCFAAFLFSVTHNYSALLAIVFENNGHSLQSTGLLLSLFAIPCIAGALLSSAACARLGVLNTARIAFLCTAIGMGAFAFTRDDFWLALASRVIQGFGVGAAMPAGMVYIQSRITPKRFVYFITVYSAVIPLAAAFSPPIGEWTMKHFGETALFIEAAIPGLLAVACTFGLRDAPRPRNTGGLNLGNAFQSRLLLPYIIVFVGGGLYGFSVNYLAADLHQRAIALAAFFVPSSIALIAIRFVGMRALAQYSPRRLLVASLLTYALGYLLIVLANGPVMMAFGGVFFGFGNSIMFPVVSAWVGEGLDARDRAGPQAVCTASFYMAIYALPWPQTFVIGAWGYAAAEWIWVFVAVFLGAYLAVLLATRRLR
jgi:MFS family permease